MGCTWPEPAGATRPAQGPLRGNFMGYQGLESELGSPVRHALPLMPRVLPGVGFSLKKMRAATVCVCRDMLNKSRGPVTLQNPEAEGPRIP